MRRQRAGAVARMDARLFDVLHDAHDGRVLAVGEAVDVDCLADGKDTTVVGIMEHIEEAGIHSGDSACALPPHWLSKAAIAGIGRASCRGTAKDAVTTGSSQASR